MKAGSYIALFIALQINYVSAQSTQHPWHVIDRGGGRSSAGGVMLQGSIGQPAVAAMTAAGTILESGYMPGLRNISGSAATLNTSVATGWNLFSVPFIVADSHKTALYPTANSNAFSYAGSYIQQSVLQNSVGYWLKFNGAGTVPITGATIAQESVAVAVGWNLIGPPSYPIPISDITPVGTTVTSNYFGYSGLYYIEDTLKPGLGYWVKVNHAGKLFMKTASVILAPKNPPMGVANYPAPLQRTLAGVQDQTGLASITFTNANGTERVLFFSTARADLDPEFYDLPPIPPSGPDVRYATNRMLEVTAKGVEREVGIVLSSEVYPITITWNLGKPSASAAMVIDGKEVTMKQGGEITLRQEGLRLGMKFLSEGSPELPKTFALHQNFPNPFNPTTTIKYDLPVDARVILKLYNTIGQEMATVKDDMETAGYQSVKWNATTAASGIYFYRIEATSISNPRKTFTQVKKMVLLK
jgi:hypothetical protein